MPACRRIALCIAMLVGCGASTALADEFWPYYWRHDSGWHVVHRGIYEMENRSAALQANPEIDDGYKGPIITGLRADIRGLNATLPPPQWRWTTPCCYGRRPIHIP